MFDSFMNRALPSGGARSAARLCRSAGVLLALGVGPLVGLTACSGGSEATDGPATLDIGKFPAEQFAASWPIQFATVDSFAAYHGEAWVTLVSKRDYRSALEGMAGGPGSARAHAEASGLYRQAALVSANAAIETYAVTPEDTDPIGAAHLLAIGWAVRGELDKAKEASARLDAVTEDVTLTWHAPWKAWLASGGAWPPDLSALPLELPPPTPGVWPELSNLPHYRMPVRTEGDHAQPMGDPGALIALALWHEAAAELAAGEDRAAIDLYLARYAFPIEPRPADAKIPMDLLYASDLLVPEDAGFLADLLKGAGPAAVDAWADRSLLARFAVMSRVDGKIDAERAVDVVNALRTQAVDLAKAKTNGEVQQHQRMFADIAYVGVLRGLSLVAEAEQNREQSGKLRILAMESSMDHTGCPVALMTLAAWDASNRYPSRAQEIIHRSEGTYPSLEAARYGLDVLALRVSRERVETPGM